MNLWIITRSYPYEGHSEPLAVYDSEKNALAHIVRCKKAPTYDWDNLEITELKLNVNPEIEKVKKKRGRPTKMSKAMQAATKEMAKVMLDAMPFVFFGDQWPTDNNGTITIRKPERFKPNAIPPFNKENV